MNVCMECYRTLIFNQIWKTLLFIMLSKFISSATVCLNICEHGKSSPISFLSIFNSTLFDFTNSYFLNTCSDKALCCCSEYHCNQLDMKHNYVHCMRIINIANILAPQDGSTPLSRASHEGHVEIVRKLFESGARHMPNKVKKPHSITFHL